MFFPAKALGIELGNDGVNMVLLGRSGDKLRLNAVQSTPFAPNTLRFSHREPNVLDTVAFNAVLTETYLKLLTKTKRVSISLPDSIGRVMIVDLETRFKNKAEGADIIRWKLKKNLPFDINETHLDFQVLRQKETGEISTLVSLVAKPVIMQYEELFLASGLEPNRIDFTTFNLLRFFSRRMDIAENYAFIGYCTGILCIFVVFAGVLDFYRVKEIRGGMNRGTRIFQELNNSLLVFRDNNPGHGISEVYCFSDTDESESFRSIAAEITGLEPFMLQVDRFVNVEQGVVSDRKTLASLVAPMGAALRNM